MRIVLGQNWNNYSENYRKEFKLQNGENVPMLWTVQNDQRQNTYDLFVQYTAYYIVKHRIQDDYSEYDDTYDDFDTYHPDLFIYGHTHIPQVARDPAYGMLLMNPKTSLL